MDLIKTGLGISKTIKNIARLREIILVLARNGFDQILLDSNLTQFLQNVVLPKSKIKIEEGEEKNWGKFFGKAFCLSFDQLGPSFIKIGQMMAGREDIFPSSFTDELKKLSNQVSAPYWSDFKSILPENLLNDIDHIEEHPLASASIGVVFKASLKSGESVVIKLRRPNILKNIQVDLDLFIFIIERVERVASELKSLRLTKAVEEFRGSLLREIDFRIEALNLKRISQNVNKLDEKKWIYFPAIFREYTTEDVLVLEYLSGVSFSDLDAINEHLDEVQEKLVYGIKCFLKTLLLTGHFHADLHGGNFFLLNKPVRLGIIDFGMVGEIGKNTRLNLIMMLYALNNQDYDNLAIEILNMVSYDKLPDFEEFRLSLKNAISPYIGLSSKQANFTTLFNALFNVLVKHQLYLTQDWFMVFKAMMTLDSVGRSLKLDFDIYAILDEEIPELVKNFYNVDTFKVDGLWLAKHSINALSPVPRHLSWWLKHLSKNSYKIEIENASQTKALYSLSSAIKILTLVMSLWLGIFLVLYLNKEGINLF